MRRVCVHNLSRPGIQPVAAAYCDSFLSRLRGLTFRRSIPFEDGLMLVQPRDNRLDSAIHMLGVFTDLAVAWIDNQYEVVDVRLARMWRPVYVPKRPCRYVLEMNPGRVSDFEVGDRVRFEEVWLD